MTGIEKIENNIKTGKVFKWVGNAFEDYLNFLETVGINCEYADSFYDDDENVITLENTLCGQKKILIKPNQSFVFGERLTIIEANNEL